jgi:hypothetical protein
MQDPLASQKFARGFFIFLILVFINGNMHSLSYFCQRVITI